jgi:hypothetical protein
MFINLKKNKKNMNHINQFSKNIEIIKNALVSNYPLPDSLEIVTIHLKVKQICNKFLNQQITPVELEELYIHSNNLLNPSNHRLKLSTLNLINKIYNETKKKINPSSVWTFYNTIHPNVSQNHKNPLDILSSIKKIISLNKDNEVNCFTICNFLERNINTSFQGWIKDFILYQIGNDLKKDHPNPAIIVSTINLLECYVGSLFSNPIFNKNLALVETKIPNFKTHAERFLLTHTHLSREQLSEYLLRKIENSTKKIDSFNATLYIHSLTIFYIDKNPLDIKKTPSNRGKLEREEAIIKGLGYFNKYENLKSIVSEVSSKNSSNIKEFIEKTLNQSFFGWIEEFLLEEIEKDLEEDNCHGSIFTCTCETIKRYFESLFDLYPKNLKFLMNFENKFPQFPSTAINFLLFASSMSISDLMEYLLLKRGDTNKFNINPSVLKKYIFNLGSYYMNENILSHIIDDKIEPSDKEVEIIIQGLILFANAHPLFLEPEEKSDDLIFIKEIPYSNKEDLPLQTAPGPLVKPHPPIFKSILPRLKFTQQKN